MTMPTAPHHKLISLALLATLSAGVSVNAFAQTSDPSTTPSPQPNSSVVIQDDKANESGLEVNEVRILGRRDAVEVKRDSGSTDYYSDKAGLLGPDEGDGLGSRSALRTWRFGN